MSDLDIKSVGEIDPYEVLNLDDHSCSADDIKRAYRRAALKSHPDKAKTEEEKAQFHTKFQQVALAYSVLSDEKRRQRYDRTGSLEEVLDDDAESLQELFAALYKTQMSPELIERDKEEYRSSGEERRDILHYYEQSHGDMDVIFENVVHSSVLDDEDRFRAVIQEAIGAKEVSAWPKFTKEKAGAKKKRRAAAEREAQEADRLAEELGLKKVRKETGSDGEGALALLIKRKQEQRFGSIIGRIEEKYGKTGVAKAKGKRKVSKK